MIDPMKPNNIIPGPRLLVCYSKRELEAANELCNGIIADKAPVCPVVQIGSGTYQYLYHNYDVVLVSRLLFLDDQKEFEDIFLRVMRAKPNQTRMKAIAIFGDLDRSDRIPEGVLAIDTDSLKCPLYHYALDIIAGNKEPYMDFRDQWNTAKWHNYKPPVDLLKFPTDATETDWDFLETVRAANSDDMVMWAGICDDEEKEIASLERLYGEDSVLAHRGNYHD